MAQTKKKREKEKKIRLVCLGLTTPASGPCSLSPFPPSLVSSESVDPDLQRPPGRFSRVLTFPEASPTGTGTRGPQGGLTSGWSGAHLEPGGSAQTRISPEKAQLCIWCLWGPEQLLSTPQDADPFSSGSETIEVFQLITRTFGRTTLKMVQAEVRCSSGACSDHIALCELQRPCFHGIDGN